VDDYNNAVGMVTISVAGLISYRCIF
jgi:hypothetical protein